MMNRLNQAKLAHKIYFYFHFDRKNCSCKASSGEQLGKIISNQCVGKLEQKIDSEETYKHASPRGRLYSTRSIYGLNCKSIN
jgi:hypothetical protein